MPNTDSWRTWINALNAGDLPDRGLSAPLQESLPPPKNKAATVFVRKLVTVTYLYSDIENMVYGHNVFEDVTVLGDMTPDKLEKVLDKERARRRGQE